MAWKPVIPLHLIFICMFSFSLSAALTTRNAVCSSTVHPEFCYSIFPDNSTWDLYDYSHFSFRQSLSTTRNLSSLFSKYLTVPSAGALKDCQDLAYLNIDFLSRIIQALGSSKLSLDELAVGDIATLFSAILANQQTCIDGLQSTPSAWTPTGLLNAPLSDSYKMYSVSLALFTRAWGNEMQSQCKHAQARKLTFPEASKEDMPSFLKGVLVKDYVVVNPKGSGDFTTISDAIDAAPNNSESKDGYFVIYIVAGVYKEYVNVSQNKTYLLMIGDGINKTVITGSHSVKDGWRTFTSPTFIVVGKGFVGVHMTIRNTAGPAKGQAVALRSGADKSTFYLCSFEGYQDTLYTHSMRQFYRECDIYGTVDFIFGDAAVVFQNCNIYPTLPLQGQSNEVTAQGRSDPNEITGTSIQNCTIKASHALASSKYTVKTYLGRPWKEYSRTVFMQSFMDSLIDPSGWNPWTGNSALSTLYYAEYNNTGPGSNTKNRVTWPGYHVIDASDAVKFTVSNFIAGDSWLPQTGVPYTDCLV